MSSQQDFKKSTFSDLIQTVHRLRAPGGCPWDRKQTHQSLRPHLIEEAYEVLDVLDQITDESKLQETKISAPFCEELGDLLMQVVLHSEMTKEAGVFGIDEVVDGLNQKLIRRHPHVFGETKVDSAEEALKSWTDQKSAEKSKDASVFDGIPRSLPALQKTEKIIDRVTQVGFQWPDLEGPIAKMEEELAELKAEIQRVKEIQGSAKAGSEEEKNQAQQALASEFGDLLFTVANLAYLMKVKPEEALRGTLARFERRFRHVEARLQEQGRTPKQSNLEEMDRYWDEAKAIERR
jgi:tetrapyrrole methylase family protein/MazG family protein